MWETATRVAATAGMASLRFLKERLEASLSVTTAAAASNDGKETKFLNISHEVSQE